MPSIQVTDEDGVVITSPHTGKQIMAKTLHVSCKSDRFNRCKNMAGMIVWMYDGKTQWRLNGVRCKSGYLYLRGTGAISGVDSKEGQVHGKLFKSLFGVDPAGKVVGTGFAFKDGQWKFNSLTFNTPAGSEWHDKNRAASDEEQRLVLAALYNWYKTGKQNFDPRTLGDGDTLQVVRQKWNAELREQCTLL